VNNLYKLLVTSRFTIPGLYYIALGDTSPGYSINFYNIIPIATFILAVLFR
jgi:hypothetical protein